jgi:hypothetical protein
LQVRLVVAQLGRVLRRAVHLSAALFELLNLLVAELSEALINVEHRLPLALSLKRESITVITNHDVPQVILHL